MDFEHLGIWFSWILVPPDHVFWFPRPVSRDMRGACQVADLTLMIRATRGRSRRPNHMRGPLDALQTPTPVALRRFPRGLHNVAKQASFNIVFGVDLESFGKPKSMPKFDFRAIFFRFNCRKKKIHRNLVHFWRFKTRNIAIFPLEKQWFSQNRLFR